MAATSAANLDLASGLTSEALPHLLGDHLRSGLCDERTSRRLKTIVPLAVDPEEVTAGLAVEPEAEADLLAKEDTRQILPGILAKKTCGRARPGGVEFAPLPVKAFESRGEGDLESRGEGSRVGAAFSGLSLLTPSSCASNAYRCALTPQTPDLRRENLTVIEGGVRVIFFDFDGTLTATPGETAVRREKARDLARRAPLLAPYLRSLRDEEVTLGIISKTARDTIEGALEESGLADLFDGPIVAKAIGFNGKAGFIEELVETGAFPGLAVEDIDRVLLVDDDLLELDRARSLGIQTLAAPETGGLQEEDLDEIVRSTRL